MSIEARGAISGVEFRQTHCGAVVGRKSTASYQSTPLQQLTRGRLIAANRAWETLSEADRSAWHAHATHPATGRNTYIAMWLRFTLAEVTPLQKPSIALPADPLKSLHSHSFIATPGLITIEWTRDPRCWDLMLSYLYSTFSYREKPTISKLRYHSKSATWDGSITILSSIITPVYHILLRQISFETGDMISDHIFRVVNPGW